MNAGRLIRPQKGPQEQILASTADIVIGGGAAGGGKTYALLMDPLRWLSIIYGIPSSAPPLDVQAVLFRRTMKQVTNPGGLWQESARIYGPANGVPRQTPTNRWNWKSGPHNLEIRFAHLERDITAYDWQGAQMHMVGFDELTLFSEWQFFYIITRLRTTDTRIKPYVRATTNPEADSWVKRLIQWWLDPETGYAIQERGGVIRWFVRVGDEIHWGDSPEDLRDFSDGEGGAIPPISMTFIPAKLSDNKKLMESNPEYRSKLLMQNEVDRERLLYGNWNIRPTAGLYFQRGKVEVVDVAPANLRMIVRGWDLAGTPPSPLNPDPDWTTGTKIGVTNDGRYVVLDHVYEQLDPTGVRNLVRNIATQDGRGVTIAMPQDPAQAGKDQRIDYAKLLAGYDIRFRTASGDKLTRFKGFSAQVGAGNVMVVRGLWNERWFRELENFPPQTSAGHDDDADSTAEAFNSLLRQSEPPSVGSYM